ncbi:hybrid sensor histidine kinase/response regulator [Catenovulum agarivorans]|uniref:hybrid sensor histidine kinase/response regulator n=1 Tax=Catenovulum agarivorans TaxID=1172192 RepID=UPI0002EF2C62|nr:PAS domain S-box protein [Catenovulum agarivorans]
MPDTNSDNGKISKHHLNLLTQSEPMAFYVKFLDTGRVEWSAQMFQLFQLKDTKPLSFTGELKCIHPQDQSKFVEAYKRAINDKVNFHVSYRLVIGGETIKVKHQAAYVSKSSGDELHGLLQIQPAEQANSQQNLITGIIENIAEPIIAISKNGAVQFINKAAEKCFGYSKEQIIGKNVAIFMPDEIAHHHNDFIHRYLNTGHTYVINAERELSAVRKNGETFAMRLSVSVVPNVQTLDENDIAFVGLVQDLTAVKIAESLAHKNTRLDALSHLAGGIAHDVNNILNVISGHLEILQIKKADDESVVKRTQSALKGVERGRQLTNRLSRMSRIDERDAEPVNLSLLIREHIELLKDIAKGQVQIEFDLQEDLRWVNIDPHHLLDSLINLCINANDAMPDGGLIQVSAHNVYLDADKVFATELVPGEHVCLSIKDTGVGMDEQTKQNIFQPFYTTKGKKGSGLGLSLAYNFVKSCRGYINVESQLGRGSCFNIYFPVIDYKQTNSNEPKVAKAVNMDFEQSFRGKRVLVVDDEKPILQLLSEFLKIYGLEVETADSGESGLVLAKNQDFDIILSDLVMPGQLDGAQFAGEVLKQKPQSTIIFMSGYTDNRLSDKQELADIPIINKPFRKKELLNQMHQMLH